jgi:cell division GTPase FtsZ
MRIHQPLPSPKELNPTLQKGANALQRADRQGEAGAGMAAAGIQGQALEGSNWATSAQHGGSSTAGPAASASPEAGAKPAQALKNPAEDSVSISESAWQALAGHGTPPAPSQPPLTYGPF